MAGGVAFHPIFHDDTMSRKPRSTGSAAAVAPPAAEPAPRSEKVGDGGAEPRRRRKRTPPGFEDRIGYKFKDGALLEQALTHISALAGPRNRASSYQRLEFLGDHVLGLVISDMLFGAFPKADEGELSRRLA